jgi:hypothetical protein
VTLTRQEMLELKAQDGLLTEAEARELPGSSAADAWREVAAELRQALQPPAIPLLADSVMELVTSDPEAPELVAAGALLAQAVRDEAGSTTPLWDGVLQGIESDWLETRALLREAVLTEAGEVHLADGVLAAISETEGNLVRLLQPSHRTGRTPSAPSAHRSARRPFVERYLPTIVGLAAAAALLVVFWTPPPGGNGLGGNETAYDLSPVNRVQIEDISGDSNAMVEVLAFDEDSPPIIFIDEGDDGLDLDRGSSSEGAPL